MPAVIIGGTVGSISEAATIQLPKRSAILRTIQRVRQAVNPQLPTPASRKELEIPHFYSVTTRGEPFLMHDSGGDDDRFLIFSTNENLRFLARCDQWFADGTFSSVPTIFLQLYTVHGLSHGKTLPLIYLLAPNKSTRMYTTFLQWIKAHTEDSQPQRMVVDFEPGVIRAIRRELPDTEINGCYFHFRQCLWRAVQTLRLQTYDI